MPPGEGERDSGQLPRQPNGENQPQLEATKESKPRPMGNLEGIF